MLGEEDLAFMPLEVIIHSQRCAECHTFPKVGVQDSLSRESSAFEHEVLMRLQVADVWDCFGLDVE